MSVFELARENRPPRPFLKWVGGKRQLLPELLVAVERAGPFGAYHEPFLGGGALFFSLARAGLLRDAALHDVNPNLVTAYEGIRDDVTGVLRELRRHAARHDEPYFYRVRKSAPRKSTTRAARVIYLNRTCFNGLYRENSKGQFNAPIGHYKNPRIVDEENLLAVSAVLRDVGLAAADFGEALALVKPGDLIYLDPPYLPVSATADFTAYAKGGFGLEAQARLAKRACELARMGVKVIASNAYTALARELYEPEFRTREVRATRRVNSRADRRGAVSEALFTNF